MMVCEATYGRYILERETPDGRVLGGVGSNRREVIEAVARGLVREGSVRRAWVIDRVTGVLVFEVGVVVFEVDEDGYLREGLFEGKGVV